MPPSPLRWLVVLLLGGGRRSGGGVDGATAHGRVRVPELQNLRPQGLSVVGAGSSRIKTDDSTGPQAPPGFGELLIGDTDQRGTVLRPPNCTLTQPGAETVSSYASWHKGNTTLTYQQTYREYGSYNWVDARTVCGPTCAGVTWTPQTFPLLPNRKYRLRVIIIHTIRTLE
jgi:hypothetical protein